MATERLVSAGRLAVLLQKPVHRVQAWIVELKAEPKLVLNGQAFFDETAIHDAVTLKMCGKVRVTEIVDELDAEEADADV